MNKETESNKFISYFNIDKPSTIIYFPSISFIIWQVLQCIKSDPSVIMWDTNMNCVLETSTEYSHWRQFGITLTRRLLYYLACSLKHSTQGTLSKSYNQCVRPKLIPVWRKQSARICSRLHYFTYSQFSCAFCMANHYGKYLISWHLGINQSY